SVLVGEITGNLREGALHVLTSPAEPDTEAGTSLKILVLRHPARAAPVGYSNHEHLLLMQSNKGDFYGAFDDFLCALGSEAEEMIENLLNQEEEPLV
ncbi:MAG TPA: hypothetical protein VFQ68_37785, partial [Streptosporangiaceae bacterium]|nr:hypothetical protein [Streptosporangiaceae bacterium]